MSAAVERPWKRQPETAPRPRGSPHAWQKKSEPATSSPAETETRARAPAGNGADESEAPPKPAVHEQIRARLLIDPDAIRAHIKMLHERAADAKDEEGESIKGVLLLVRFEGDNNKPKTEQFSIGDHEEMAKAAVGWAKNPHLNLYAP
jgi:hypothetical protein